MENHFTGLDWLVLAGYFAATLAIGFSFRRRANSAEGFTAARRALPGWVCGLSIFATYLSSISFLALPGKSYSADWNPFVFSLSLPLATWIAVRWFLPYYRSTGEISAYAHLEHRFGPWARIYASVFYLLTQIARTGSVLYLMAVALSAVLQQDIRIIILITGLSVTVYAFVGGIVAVIWTDAFQALVLMAGAGICVLVLLLGMPEGPEQVFTIAADHDKFSLGSIGGSVSAATFWVVLAYGLCINLQNFGIDQSYVQRYIASRSDTEARKSVWLGGLLYVPVSAVFFFIGTALFAWHQTHPEDRAEVNRSAAVEKLKRASVSPESPDYQARLAETVASLTPGEIGDKVFPHFIAKRLPPGLTGLLIAAVLAAAMSTISTSLNSSATLLLSDFYQRYLNPGAGERACMRVLHAGTIVWGVLGTGTALLMVGVTSALDTWWFLASIFSGGTVGLFLLGMISRRAGNPAAITGVLVGLLVILWMTVSPHWVGFWSRLSSPFHQFLVIVIGTLVILLVGLLLARARPVTHSKKDEEIPRASK
jgi:solute:Na+ symporter, SSS family